MDRLPSLCAAAPLALCLIGAAPRAALAQAGGAPPPSVNPGAVLKDTQRLEQQLESPSEQAPEPYESLVEKNRRPPVTPPAAATGRGFLLKGITFTPSVFLTKDELDGISRDFVGKVLDTAALQRLIGAINALYDEKGIVTGAATLPRQRVENGILRILLAEGKLGEVHFTGNAYTSPDFILDRLSLAQGEVLDLPVLDKDILAFNRIYDVRLQGALSPGKEQGFTDVDLRVQEPPREDLSIFADNEGTDTTSAEEIGFIAHRIGTLLDDDHAAAFMTWSRGSINGNFSYDAPIDLEGDRLGGAYSQNAIKIVGGSFRDLLITGQSRTGAVTLTHPIWASPDWVVTSNGALSEIVSLTDESGKTFSDDRSYKGSLGFSVTHIGTSHVLTLAQDAAVVANHNVDGVWRRLFVYDGSLSGQYDLGGRFRLTGLLAWQWSPVSRLPAVFLTQIGGPTTVRGYRSNVLSGDKGYYGNLELHRDVSVWDTPLDLYTFLDRGVTVGGSPQHKGLTSTGFGSSWNPTSYLTGEFSMGFPIEHGALAQDTYRLYGRLIFHVL